MTETMIVAALKTARRTLASDDRLVSVDVLAGTTTLRVYRDGRPMLVVAP